MVVLSHGQDCPLSHRLNTESVHQLYLYAWCIFLGKIVCVCCHFLVESPLRKRHLPKIICPILFAHFDMWTNKICPRRQLLNFSSVIFFQHSLSINTARSNATVQKYFDHLLPLCILDLLRHFASASWEHLWGLLQKISIMSIQGPDRSVTRYFWAALKFLPCNYDLIILVPTVYAIFKDARLFNF